MTSINTNRPEQEIILAGASFALGSSCFGQVLAPSYLRNHGIVNLLNSQAIKVRDLGDIATSYNPAELRIRSQKAHYLAEVSEYQTELFKFLKSNISLGDFLLLIGGDHSVSAAGFAARQAVYNQNNNEQKLGLLWVDTHADINTLETTISGRLHGMILSSLAGLGPLDIETVFGKTKVLDLDNLVYLGLRDLDLGEVDLIKNSSIKAIYTQDIKSRGLESCLAEALAYLSSKTEHYIASFDFDVCDPSWLSAVANPVPDGINISEASELLTKLGADPKCIGLDLVEFDPTNDPNSESLKAILKLVACFAEGMTQRF